MLITIQEDGVLRIYQSVEEAIGEVEALDAEDVFRSIFDETRRCYALSWIRPNHYGRFWQLTELTHSSLRDDWMQMG
jgi:hypothetical protein